MHFFILSIFWLLIFFSFIYILVILTITIGWFRIRGFKSIQTIALPNVSIVIAVRNEQKNIKKILTDLIYQDYPLDQLEVLIVNDHSDDDTVKRVQIFKDKNKNINIQLAHSSGIGKKEAIREGIHKAAYGVIVTTDGDCSFGVGWLRRMVEYYLLKGSRLVVGPVVYLEKKNLLQKFYTLDFMSLVASSAGSLGVGLPLMANGANLLFTKQTFEDVIHGQSGSSFASGDDVFLLHAVSKKYGASSVNFIKDPLSIVTTTPPDNFKSFLSQRKRWASKATAYRSWWPVLVSVSVFGLNLMLVLSFLATFLKLWFLVIFGLFVLLKTLIDFPLLQSFSEFSNRKKVIPYVLLFGFLYPFYIVFTAVPSFFFRFSWKGRNNVK